MASDMVFKARVATLGGAGTICAGYGLLALITGRPDPLPVWIPGVAGVIAFLVIWLAAAAVGPRAAAQAFDESYRADARRAQSLGFWVAVWSYPVFGFLLWQGVVSFPVAFAAMGTLLASVYLICLTWLDMKGRA